MTNLSMKNLPMNKQTPIIQIKQLWKEYGDNIVLERLNLDVNEGEFVSIVGASGCGKTTFLNLLLGTERPSRGSILLDGEPLKGEPSVERGIVFQKYSVFPHLTALENVMIGQEFESGGVSQLLGRTFGKHKSQVKAAAQAMLTQVGLGHSMHQYPHELSGGMRQRLSIAQSLIKQPRILLLDEPFGALDPGIRKDMHQLIKTLWETQQLTVFMITHDLSEGFHLGNRLWVFDYPRKDEQAPERYGAQVTFDLPLDKSEHRHFAAQQVQPMDLRQTDLQQSDLQQTNLQSMTAEETIVGQTIVGQTNAEQAIARRKMTQQKTAQ